METLAEGEELRYVCIDLKSFYASVECVERGLNPMTTLLAVADPQRGDGTICLAVSPAMKALGVKNRCRVFEIPPRIRYIKATPRMRLYMEYSRRVVDVYREFVSDDDIHVYSVDEAFIDLGPYLKLYGKTAPELGRIMVEAVKARTGIPAACGVGTNLYLAKIALDITAKHSPDFMGILTQHSYRETLWDYLPITDFWMIGQGTQRRLWSLGLCTMRDVACCDEDLLYREFGVNAELLIDHSKGIEPVRMEHLKAYRSKTSGLSAGQVLLRDYRKDEALVIVKEMISDLCLKLSKSAKLCRAVSLTVTYSHTVDFPPAKGTVSLPEPDNSAFLWTPPLCGLYAAVTSDALPIRRIDLYCAGLMDDTGRQLTFFDGDNDRRDLRIQRAVSRIKDRYGKNALFNCMDLLDAATARQRNAQIGGHRG